MQSPTRRPLEQALDPRKIDFVERTKISPEEAPLDLRVLELLTCFLSLLAGLAAGVLPALVLRLRVERTADARPFLGLDREAFDDLLEDA